MPRQFSLLDRVLAEVDHALRTTLAGTQASEPSFPGDNEPDIPLTEPERGFSEGLMRVNHTGEIAAQALYRGQALVAKEPAQQAALLAAAAEEQSHLDWCSTRLRELNGRASLLAPGWYAGSFLIGLTAGFAGDKQSLGFVEETEIQVSAHLEKHIARLPRSDRRSRAILRQMRLDETRHAEAANAAGADQPSPAIKFLMARVADVMKFVSFRI